jgi:GH25 family lysozyme M1 (1,4-beta-N-acetylmuramidase)
MSYQDFKNTHLGNGYDIDGWWGWQCYDFYAEYCNYLGVPYANCTDSGYAQDLWTQRHSNGILNYFDEVEVMQPGDVAIFAVTPSTPYSHVAIFDSDAGNGYGYFLGQNQGSDKTNPNGGSASNIVALPYSATFATAFRPKQSNNTAVITNNSEPSSVVSGMKKDDYFIDVSAYQPGDLTDICNASGTRNTIIKVTEGVGWLSPVATQQTNTSNCVGYYHFARFGGDVGLAQAEADFFISNLPSKPRYLVCDYEDSASGNVQANTDAVIAFMDKCKQAGFEPIYYSYKPYTLANVYIDQVTAKYPNSLWIAAYPNYEVTPTPYWGVFPSMDNIRWWQFTSTGIAGGLDKNIVLIDDEVTSSSVEEEDEEMTNFVARNQTGDSGYVAVVNGRVFGIGDMETVFQLQNAGAKHLNLPDADFGRFIDSQSRDAQEIKQAIADANAKVVEAIEKIKSTSVQDALGKVTIKGNLEVSNEG